MGREQMIAIVMISNARFLRSCPPSDGLVPWRAFLINIAKVSRMIEMRPFRGGWQCWEGDGVGPYWVGPQAQEQAISGAGQGIRCEIRIVAALGSFRGWSPTLLPITCCSSTAKRSESIFSCARSPWDGMKV
jgi:hypothetical protein